MNSFGYFFWVGLLSFSLGAWTMAPAMAESGAETPVAVTEEATPAEDITATANESDAPAAAAEVAGSKPGPDQGTAQAEDQDPAAESTDGSIGDTKAAESFKDCDLCPEMVRLPQGEFTLGSQPTESGRNEIEGPVPYPVVIDYDLAVGKFEVTIEEYRYFLENSKYKIETGCWNWLFDGGSLVWKMRSENNWENPGFTQSDRDPVVCLNWTDARAYVKWLAKKTGKPYRLLTEAEWEYAARSGRQTRYAWGDDLSHLNMCRHANGADQALKIEHGSWTWSVWKCMDTHIYTTSVGTFLPNSYGLYDMQGNAAEWVEDCWNPQAYQTHEAYPKMVGTHQDLCERVSRGGSWLSSPLFLRVAYRNKGASHRLYYRGLRVALPIE